MSLIIMLLNILLLNIPIDKTDFILINVKCNDFLNILKILIIYIRYLYISIINKISLISQITYYKYIKFANSFKLFIFKIKIKIFFKFLIFCIKSVNNEKFENFYFFNVLI